MSDLILSAEHYFFACVGSMQELLNSIDDALPKRLLPEVKSDESVMSEMEGKKMRGEGSCQGRLGNAQSAYLSIGTNAESSDDTILGTSSGLIPDTLLQRLEWEHDAEQRHLSPLISGLHQRIHHLKGAIAALGGGIDGQGRVVDVPLAVLDQDIDLLSKENVRLGDILLAKYSEAEMIAGKIEEEIMTAAIPNSL